MRQLQDALLCQRECDALRRAGKRIALVPTMGALHEGHLALLREGRRLGDVLALSIFVNPTQFAPQEDLSRYPSDLEGDLRKAESAGVDLVFLPSRQAMYPEGAQTLVEVRELGKVLCGRSRPGHFTGVATVVAALFHIVSPHVAVFGEKDYQQLVIIRRLVRDLHFGVEIASVPIVREPDGLALSSRNVYLSGEERKRALALWGALGAAQEMVRQGHRDAPAIQRRAREVLEPAVTKIDYVELVDPETLAVLGALAPGRSGLLALAAFVGATRLIDNTLLTG